MDSKDGPYLKGNEAPASFGHGSVRIRLRVRSFGRGWRGGGGLRVHQVLQFLAGLEIRDAFSRHFDARPRFWIASHARLPLSGSKTAEAANLDLVPGTQR